MQPLNARHCTFCGKHLGCFAYPISMLERLGGETGNGYAHLSCLGRAKRKYAKKEKKIERGRKARA